uniref:BZIP domain-containing protein n=1 Tax=Kalanchoe fedtschenkoi TaxID=63787 RepID=A0A7N0SXK4_KALFE
MGTNLNFNYFGGGGGGGGVERQLGDLPLTRQTSIYALTFDELQSAMGGNLGKDFGSMNMDELLKNIWTAEESHTTAAVAGNDGGVGVGSSLQRQGSVTLPRTLSHKTVDEIWKDMTCKEVNGGGGGGGSGGFTQRQPTLGEITLEEFLVRAGVVREDANTPQNLAFGFQQAGLMSNSSNQMMMQSANLPMNVNGVTSSLQQPLAASQAQPLFPKQPGLSYGHPLGLPGGAQLGSPRLRGGLVGVSDPRLIRGGGLGVAGLGPGAGVTVAVGSPAQLASNGDTSSLSPVPYVFNGGVRGRRANGAVEKVVERRQRRMIKNRESAARSRARKQAYTTELEAEVAKLKEENQELQKKQAEIMEMHKNQVLEMMSNQGGGKRQCLRRTQTGPW